MNNTLIKGLQLLEALSGRSQAAGVSELAVELGMGKSNVHRTLQALVERGYVINEDGRGVYRASLKLWEIGSRVLTRLDVRACAAPAMRWLLEQSRETVHLSVLDGEEVVYLDKLDSPEPVRAYSEIGGRAPAHCVATGKALLAWQQAPDALALASAKRRKMPAYTPSTLTDAEQMSRELARIRLQGYAVNRGEWRTSVWGIAAPIVNGAGEVIAAIGLSGPATRVKPARIKPLASLVVQAAAQVSNTLTGKGPVIATVAATGPAQSHSSRASAKPAAKRPPARPASRARSG